MQSRILRPLTRGVIFVALALFNTVTIAWAAPRPLPTDVWPMYQYAADRNAVFDSPGWDVTWKADIGAKSNGGLSIVGHTLLVESFDKSLYAFDALTGKQLWRAPLQNIAMGAPIVADGIVIVGTGSNDTVSVPWSMQRAQGDEIDAFDIASGKRVWSHPTVGENMPTGVYMVVHNVPEYVFSNGDNHAYALDAKTGRVLWQSPTMGINAMSDLATDGHSIYGIAEYSWQRLFDNEGGAADAEPNPWAWTWSVNPSNGWFNWRAPFGVADGGVTVSSETVFLQSVDLVSPKGPSAVQRSHQIGWVALLNEAKWSTHVVALDTTTGTPRWQYVDDPNNRSYKTSGTFSTTGTVVDGVLYDPLQISRHIAAFNVQTGAVLWKTATRAPVKMALLVNAGRIYAGDTDGNLYVLDAKTGAILHALTFPNSFTPSPPVIVGNTLYVTNGDTLYALRVSDLDNGLLSIQ